MTDTRTISARYAVANTQRAEHGGESVGAGSSVRHDFSTCVNAFGPARAVTEAIRRCDVVSYPDRQSVKARQAAATVWNRPLAEVICGAGAAELIHAVCFTFVSAGDSVLILAPAFGEYERAARLCGARVHACAMPLSHDATDWSEATANAAQQIRFLNPRLVFAASPTSPTGYQLTIAMIRELADACGDAGSLLVLDQSYDAFALEPLGTPALADHPNVLHLRSITKEHALAGVRVAFAVGDENVVNSVERSRVPWATSAIAQAAAAASFLSETVAHVAQTLQVLHEETSRLAIAMRSMAYQVSESSTHYLLIEVGNARNLRQSLAMDHQLLVRDCSSFGLPAHIRIAARRPVENDALLTALQSVGAVVSTSAVRNRHV